MGQSSSGDVPTVRLRGDLTARFGPNPPETSLFIWVEEIVGCQSRSKTCRLAKIQAGREGVKASPSRNPRDCHLEPLSLPVFDSRWRTVLTPCPGSSQTILASLGRPKRHHPTFSPVFRPVARRSAPIAFYPNSDGRRRLAPPGLLSSWSIPLPTAHPAKFGSSHSPSPRPTSSLPAYSLIPLSMIPPPHRNRP